MPSIGPSRPAHAGSSPGPGVDREIRRNLEQFDRVAAVDRRVGEEMHRNLEQFDRGIAVGRRVDGEMHRHLDEFSRQPGGTKLPASGALDGLAGKKRPLDAQASGVPGAPPLPPKGANLPSRAALYAPNSNPKRQPVASAGASHLGRLDPATGVFVGSGRWSGADQPPTAAPRRQAPLQEHEFQQAGYQLATRLPHDADGPAGRTQPIDDPVDVAHLRAATETMHQTRTDLQFGRGNIAYDAQVTNGMSSARAGVAYQMADRYGLNADGQAGVALALGAANCDHNGAINTRRYAPMLGDGETVSTVGNSNIHHTWSQVDPQPKATADGLLEPRPTIIMDSWADGPAVHVGDSRWAEGAATTLATERFDRTQGLQRLDVMNQARADTVVPGGPLNIHVQPLFEELARNPPRGGMFAHSSVVGTALATESREKLAAQSPLTRELMSVAAVRQAYDLNVAEATQLATTMRTLQAAATLDTPSRPAIVIPAPPAA